MEKSASKLASGRQSGVHQLDWQRARILDIAQALFLQQGLKNVRMGDIAAAAGMTKTTLYRYFANVDEIAVEIHERMLSQVVALVQMDQQQSLSETFKRLVQAMIRNFEALRSAYRYIGMFDSLYLDHLPGTSVTEWTKNHLAGFFLSQERYEDISLELQGSSRYAVILNTVTWFLEKLAMRGELTWSDPAVPLEDHLKTFEDMILSYIEAHAP